MFRRSLIALTSVLTFGNIFISTESAKAQCDTNDIQCWLDYSEQVLTESNQLLEQIESQGEKRINSCLQGEPNAYSQLQLNNQSWQIQQPYLQPMYEMKQRSLQDTACIPYGN